ncbi:restriction endonuclease subunit S [Streptococcus mutans]|uniref:restriction endonuclease subunit S n=2 Tax=Streptococcus mutans TaxID=1309 RepID=UPI00233037F5|nr:restriction endonuclease subunit S [Streptococcus mutans]MDB8632203.1 restriction endonuclease subunit S [Streptococcus mutans]
MTKTPKLRFPGFTDAWEQRKLGEVAEVVGGGTPSTSIQDYWDGDIDWYSPAEIGNQIFLKGSQKKITELGIQSSSAKILPVGTVLFTSRAGIGNTAILTKEGATNQGFQSIVPNIGKLNSYFIFSRTDELKKYGETQGAGSTFVEVSGKQMSKMPISLPPLPEQEAIGAFFRQLDELLTLHQRKLDEVKNLKKSLLQKMFPKNGERIPEVRFPEFTAAWEQDKVSKLMVRVSEISDTTDIPTIEYEDVVSGSGSLIPGYERKETNKKGIIFQNGDVLFGKLRPYLKNWLLAEFDGKAVGDWWVLHSEKLNSEFQYSLIQNSQFQEVANISTGTKMPRSDWKLVSEVKLFFPTLPEQEAIGAFFRQLDELLTLHQRKLEHLQSLKRALLQQMFI